jgi:hypothetical protein
MHGCKILQKCGVMVVILLCIGIAVAPGGNSNIVKVSTKDIVIGVPVQVYGMRGFGTHMVSLTIQQYQDLERYLVDFRARLNTTTCREQAVSLFNEAVVEIHNYGLLPQGMSVEQAQRLVRGSSQQSKMLSQTEIDSYRGGNKRDYEDMTPKLKNALCLLSATATKIPDYYPRPVILPFGLLLLFGLLPAFFVSLLGQEELANMLVELGLRVWNSNPFRVSNYVMILGYEVELRSVGLKGIVNENLTDGVVFRGYSGLMLYSSNEKPFFLGFAINVISPR